MTDAKIIYHRYVIKSQVTCDCSFIFKTSLIRMRFLSQRVDINPVTNTLKQALNHLHRFVEAKDYRTKR